MEETIRTLFRETLVLEMTSDPNDLVTLKRVYCETEAAVIVNALAEVGIRAIATGGFTSGFKAEAPGVVAVQVLRSDLAKAHELLRERTEEFADEWPEDDN